MFVIGVGFLGSLPNAVRRGACVYGGGRLMCKGILVKDPLWIRMWEEVFSGTGSELDMCMEIEGGKVEENG